MPDEILQEQEAEIINRFVKKLREVVDSRILISRLDKDVIHKIIDRAVEEYDRLY